MTVNVGIVMEDLSEGIGAFRAANQSARASAPVVLKGRSYYRGCFGIASANQTRAAGFGAAALIQGAKPTLAPRARVGVIGYVGAGKSTFCEGFLKAMGGRNGLRRGEDFARYTTPKGLVFHADAVWCWSRLEELSPGEEPGVDIIEHAQMLKEGDRNFDLIAMLEGNGAWRGVTILADEEIAQTEAFAAFCASLEHLEAAR